MANDFKTAQPLEFYKQFLKEKIRPDGRGLMEFRKTLLNVDSINTANGSALVRLGHTMVVCGIKAELSIPTVDNPDCGFFVPNVELPPACSPEFRPGPPGDKAQVLSKFIFDTVESSKLISLEDLCINAGKLSWVIYADLVCLSHDGNLIDALFTALYAALKNTKLPVINYDEETACVKPQTGETFELKLRNQPVSTTVALFDDSLLLVDPTHEEEELSSGMVTVVVGNDQQLCSVYKPGECPISEGSLRKCIQAALDRQEEVNKLLDMLDETIDR